MSLKLTKKRVRKTLAGVCAATIAMLSTIAIIPTTVEVQATTTMTVEEMRAALPYTDKANISDWAVEAVYELYQDGSMTGNADGSFGPQDNINRASVATVLVNAKGLTIDTTGGPHFTDVPADQWFYTFVETAKNNSIVGGYKDADGNATGMFGPADNVNRADAAVMIKAAFEIPDDIDPPSIFPDVMDDTAYFYNPVVTLYNQCVVNGYSNGNFGPGDIITREQSAVMINAAMSPTNTCREPEEVKLKAESAEATGLTAVEVGFSLALDKDSAENTDNYSITEGLEVTEAVLLSDGKTVELTTDSQDAGTTYKVTVSNVMNNDKSLTIDEENDEVTFSGYTNIVTGDGVLEIAICDDTPVLGKLPGNVAGVEIAKFCLTASDEDVKLTSLEMTRGGLGEDDSVVDVALFDTDGNRISKSKTFNSTTDIATINILDGGYTIGAGDTEEITVKATLGDAATYVGSDFFMEITDTDNVFSNAKEVTGNFPVQSDEAEIGATDGGELELNNDGSPSDPKLGEVQAEISKFKLKNNSDDNDIDLYSITLEQTGSIDEEDELENYALYIEGDKVAELAQAKNEYIALVLDEPYRIKEGDTVKAKVKADIVGGANEDISFDLDSTLDITTKDTKYGYGASITYDTTYGNEDVDVEAGEISIVATDAPNDEILIDKDDVVAGTMKVISKAGKDLEVDSVEVTIEETTGTRPPTDVIENVEIYDATNGTIYDLSSTSTVNQTTVYSDDNLDIPLESEHEFQVRFDTLDKVGGVNLLDGLTFDVSVDNIGGDGFKVKETEDDKVVTDITPSSISFKSIDGVASSVDVNTLTMSADKSAVIGSEGIEVLKFELKAGSASDLTLDEVKVKGAVTDNGTGGEADLDNTRINKLALYEDSFDPENPNTNLLDEISASQLSSEEATFDGFDVNIDADETKNFIVAVDIVDDENQASDELQFELTSLSIDDIDSDSVEEGNVDGTSGVDITAMSGDAVSERVVTIKGVGELSIIVDNTDSQTSKKKNVLAGEESDYIASFELTAVNEAVLINDLQITQSNAGVGLKDAVSDLILYDADDNQIATKSVSSDTVVFDNIDYVVEEGSENIYVAAVTLPIGKDLAGKQTADLELNLKVTDAEGDDSGKEVDPPHLAAGPANAFSVLPVRVTNVQFISSAGGINVASSLSNGENNAAIIQISTEENNNTDSITGGSLDTVITQIEFTLDTDLGASGGLVGGVTLEKVDGNDGDFACDISALPTVTCDLDGNLGGDNEITSGEYESFLVKVDVTKDTPDDEHDNYIQVNFDAFNGGEVTYESDDSAGATAVTDLRLSFTTLDGPKISE